MIATKEVSELPEIDKAMKLNGGVNMKRGNEGEKL